jgi:hypothetical protein
LNRPVPNESCSEFLQHPSDKWANTKCTLYIHMFACFVVYAAQENACTVNSWLAVYFLIMVLDVLKNEFILRI